MTSLSAHTCLLLIIKGAGAKSGSTIRRKTEVSGNSLEIFQKSSPHVEIEYPGNY